MSDTFQHFVKNSFTLKDNGKTIIKKDTSYKTVYGGEVAKGSAIFEWQIKINKLTNGSCVIGIDEANHKHTHGGFHNQSDSTIHYGYCSWNGNKWDANGKQSKYSLCCTSEDVITMQLNLNKNWLSFAKNSSKLKKAFEIEKSKIGYCLAVYFYSKNDSFSILSFKKIKTIVSQRWGDEKEKEQKWLENMQQRQRNMQCNNNNMQQQQQYNPIFNKLNKIYMQQQGANSNYRQNMQTMQNNMSQMPNRNNQQNQNNSNNNTQIEKKKEAPKLSQKENKVSEWLKKTVSKPQYIQNFISAGFDTMAGIEDMDETDLREIGIELKGHRRHILKHIKQIQTETDEKEDRPQCLSNNAGVICIAISKYDENTALHSLPDVKDDVERYKAVLGDGYNYTIMSSLDENEYKNGRMTASDVKRFINKCYAEIIVYDETDYSLSSKFDALFITVSGHGTATSLVCSDNSKIKYNKIRQNFSKDEELEAIPRIYCIDACRVFDDEVKPGRSAPNGAFSVTIMGNTEGEIVRGGKVSKFMMKHFENAKSSAKWMNFQQILENAQRDMKNDKTTDQILILTEYDLSINKVVFEPNSGGRGSKYDNEYLNETWTVMITINGNQTQYKDTKIIPNYKEKRVVFKYNNNRQTVAFKKGTFHFIRDANTLTVSMRDASWQKRNIEIKCGNLKETNYWTKKIKPLSIQ